MEIKEDEGVVDNLGIRHKGPALREIMRLMEPVPVRIREFIQPKPRFDDVWGVKK